VGVEVSDMRHCLQQVWQGSAKVDEWQPPVT
jgi:hypothetical protein